MRRTTASPAAAAANSARASGVVASMPVRGRGGLDGVTGDARITTGSGKIQIGETVPEQLKLDLDLEREALPRLNEGIRTLGDLGDNGTRLLLEEILESEEDHIDWLETQLGLIDQLGLQNWLQSQAGSPS